MIVGVIPARYASTRLPGKPLVDILGKPMIQRTYESAAKSSLLNRLIIATDDKRIFNACRSFGAEVVMTPDTLQTGSDRIAFVVQDIFDADIVVNIQGDESFIPGTMIDQAIEPLLIDENVEVSTLVRRITSFEDLSSTATVKVVFDMHNDALYFSRSIIPFGRDYNTPREAFSNEVYYKHIGLYVYRKKTLLKFTKTPQGELERIEKLEQLRLLENRIKIKVVETEYESLSVDTPEDLEFVRKKMKYFLTR